MQAVNVISLRLLSKSGSNRLGVRDLSASDASRIVYFRVGDRREQVIAVVSKDGSHRELYRYSVHNENFVLVPPPKGGPRGQAGRRGKSSVSSDAGAAGANR